MNKVKSIKERKEKAKNILIKNETKDLNAKKIKK